MAFTGTNPPGTCSFCSNLCTGAFRHVLALSEEHKSKLKPVLLLLTTTPSPLINDSYPTCDKCRRMIITSHNIPESCFQIMPSAEVIDIKVEPDLLHFDSDPNQDQDSETTLDADEIGEAFGILAPETEMRIKGENGEVFVVSGLEGRMTLDVEDDLRRVIDDLPEPLVGKVKRTRRKRGTAPNIPIKRDRSAPVRHRCPYCNKGFADKCLMTTHIRWHTGEKPFKCEHCGKGFCENSKLKLHIRTHTGERPYACPYCPKAFTQSVTLKIHIRIHTRETPYVCEYCDRGFTQSYNLTVHLRNQHNQITVYRGREVGVLPEYKCTLCGKIYRSYKSFKLHEKLHGTGKLFDCEKCGKKYTYVHKCKVTQDKDKDMVYPCLICGQEFKHQQSVVYHMSNKHDQFGEELEGEIEGTPPVMEDDEEIVGS